MQELTLTAGIIGTVKAIKEVVPQVQGVITLGIAMLLGLIAGYFHLLGTPDILSGLFIGVAAVGTVSVADRMSGK